MNYLIGQRVILGNYEIGVVVASENPKLPNNEYQVWVKAPSQGYASCYSSHNVKPLPNGQM